MSTITLHSNEVLRQFGHDIGTWVRREKRLAMSSPLYNLSGRSFLGFAVVADIAPDLVQRLDDVMSPEELGARMRVPLGRPYVLQGIMVIEGQLMARQQAIIDRGADALSDEEEARADRVVQWFARTFAAYRQDGHLFAGEEVLTQPVIDADEVDRRLDNAGPDGVDPTRIQRAFGALELYALTLHGEQRDGHFDHGPYPLGGGRWAAFHELDDLRNDVLPWSDEEVHLPVDAVGAVRLYDASVAPRFELFGTMSTTPANAPYETRALWARDGDVIRPLDIDELEDLAERAMQATSTLFMRIASWDEDFRTAYGAPLFVNHLAPFARLAGLDEVAWMHERAAEVTRCELPRLVDGTPLPVWQHLAAGGSEMFTPIRGAA